MKSPFGEEYGWVTADAPAATHPRVLFFSHETTLSGAPMQLLHLARRLHDGGWPIVFATPEPGPISDSLARAGVEIRFDSTFLTDLQHNALRSIVRGFDVVIANTIAAWPVVRAAHREQVPVVWYIHETLVGIRLIGLISEIRPTLDLADLIVTPTRATAAVYQGITRTPVQVVPYGIPDLGWSPHAEQPERTRFLLLGTYEERKGQDVMLAALHQLDAATHSRAAFTLAGRPLEREFFERLQSSAASLPNVRLLEGVTHEEAARLIRETDVLVIASRDETMPVAIIEAMSLGRGVIATDVGGIREWIRDGLNGRLVPSENAQALAGAIRDCATDPQFVAELAAAGRRTYERHFRLATLATNFTAVLQRAAARAIPKRAKQPGSYAEWIRRFDTRTNAERAALQRRLRGLRRHPLISVIMPVHDPEPAFLRAAIESVRRQLYEDWELCIADDASTNPEIAHILGEIENDPRIKIVRRTTSGHISAASNSALRLASGEWCALLDHDDALAEDALAWAVCEIDAHPDAGLIYSDEDKIDAAGARSNPFFKSDFDPELLLAQNYINHLGIYRASLLREIGGFREGFEGSQDYDLVLRVIERLRPDQVRHLPRVLYHWRTAAGSLAAVPDAKPYAREAARRAIGDHLARCAVRAQVQACPENNESHRVRYELPDVPPLVSIIIPIRDQVELLRTCLRGLQERTAYPALEIVIVDNGSREPDTRAHLDELQRQRVGVRVLRDEREFNFGRLNNLAARSAQGELLAFLNNDVEAENPEWLREMVSHAVQPSVGAVGARLWYPDDTLQHGGVVLGLGGVAGHAHVHVPRGHPGYFNRAWLQHNSSAVTAACLVMRKSVFDAVGGFNERELAVNFNDVDLCLRLRQRGLQIIWTPYANLTHRESASRGHHHNREQQQRFVREATWMQQNWGDELLHDPFYNPNLTLAPPGYSLAFPPRVTSLRA